MPIKKINSFIDKKIRGLPPEQKNIVSSWISQVEKIVQDEALTKERKIQDIENLNVSQPVLAVLEGFFESFTEFIPPTPRSWLKTGVAGGALLASFTGWKKTAVGLLAFKKFLPHFLLSHQGQKALGVLKLAFAERPIRDSDL